MQIVYVNGIDQTGLTITHSTEVAAFPAENVQNLQPSEFFRTTVLDPGWIQFADFDSGLQAFALPGTVATAHRNLLRYSNTLTNAEWTKTGTTVTQDTDVVTAGSHASFQVDEGAGAGTHYVEQALTTAADDLPTDVSPGSYASDYWAASGVARQRFATDRHVRLEIRCDALGELYANFNLSTGAVQSTFAASGRWSNVTATITSLGNSVAQPSYEWFYFTLVGEVSTGSVSNLQVRLYVLDDSFATSYTGANLDVLVQCLTLENGASVCPWVDTGSDSAAWWQVEDTSGPGNVLMAWNHLVGRDLTDRSQIAPVHSLTSASAAADLKVSVFDGHNLNSQIDIGRIVAGNALSLSGKLVGFSPDLEETGGESRARGGQRYRGVHPKTTVHELVLEYLTRDEAYGDIMKMYRNLGRSTPGLFIADEDETTYLDEFSIYGFLDGGHPIPRQMGSYWQTRFRVVEVI